jgi:DNA-binding response OmpR family regulator
MITVLLVEDDSALREGLEEFLRLQGFEVTAVANGVDCFTAIINQSFNVAVIDLGLPDISGLQIIEHLRRCSSTAIVVLTASVSLQIRVGSYLNGADLFLGKPVQAIELAAAIKSLATRQSQNSPATAPQNRHRYMAGWRLNNRQCSLISPDGISVRLTAKEFEFIVLIANEAGTTVSRNRACEALYQRDDESSQAALTSLVRRVRLRFAESGIFDIPIITMRGAGYRFSGELEN